MKKVFIVLLSIILCTALALTAYAASDTRSVYDDADLLTSAEERTLNQRLQEVGSAYDAHIVVVTVSSTGGRDPERFADDLYDDMDFGYGSNRDGVMLLVSMSPRKFCILSNGAAAGAITQKNIESIEDCVVSDLSDGAYADAFNTFADECDQYLDAYKNGPSFNLGKNLLICAVIGIVVGMITVLVLKSQLKSVRMQNQAYNYVRPGSMHLTHSADIFLYRNVTRVAKPQNNSGSRGSGSSRNIGGRSF